MWRIKIVFFSFLIISITTKAQVRVNRVELLKIAQKQDSLYNLDQQFIRKLKKNIPGLRVKNSTETRDISLQRILSNGHPVYYTTYNKDAARITNIEDLHPDGSLELGLSGMNVPLAVWDGGLVAHHIEFQNRLQQIDGETVSNHATHVTGTLIAEGIDPKAKGMAFNAYVRSHDFNNDLSEIASEAINGTVISNHSYGMVNGWDINDNGNWQWYGDATISTLEDYNFGFYNYKASELDKIALNAPFYSIVWAAGNDRQDVGNGTRPPDGNGGTGYDCISAEATAKNILTIGAIKKFNEYIGPSSISISDFSSWGPTDDGRVKPDLVGVGVNLYSTSSEGDNSYTFMSGTSMAAPNVAGGLTLLQELHHNLHGKYMKSATLKALAIHSTKEAGQYDGPDYIFGWGLFDAQKAAELLLKEKESSGIYIEDQILNNSEELKYDLYAEENTQVKITIAWTDPQGSPVQPSLDPNTIMLVNDLDIRMVDDTGREFYPWTLNPARPNSPAVKSMNFRDNVEKLEFIAPQSRKYTLIIDHKSMLTNEQQPFSLIIEYNPIIDNNRKTLYWIGNSEDWHNGNNWSLESGGIPANQVPGENDYVIFDENSFDNIQGKVELSDDAQCFGLLWLYHQNATINMNNNILLIHENLRVDSDSLHIASSGSVIFGNKSIVASLGSVKASDIHFIFENENNLLVKGNLTADTLTFKNGSVTMQSHMQVSHIFSTRPFSSSLNFDKSHISGLKVVDLYGASHSFKNTIIEFSSFQQAEWRSKGVDVSGYILNHNMLTISGEGNTFDKISNAGILQVIGGNRIDSLVLRNAGLHITSGDSLIIGKSLITEGENTITALGDSKAFIFLLPKEKFCLDSLNIQNIDLLGNGAISAGENSTISNADNWSDLNCRDLILPWFFWQDNCAGGLTMLVNQSSGDILHTKWQVNTDEHQVILTGDTVYFSFPHTGTYQIDIILTGREGTYSMSRNIVVVENDEPLNHIVDRGDQLVSFKPATAYQWFYNGSTLITETARTLANPMEGEYFVVTYYEKCNRVSDTLRLNITAMAESKSELFIYPLPVKDDLFIESPNTIISITVTSAEGKIIFCSNNIQQNKTQIILHDVPPGVYIIHVETTLGYSSYKLIKH